MSAVANLALAQGKPAEEDPFAQLEQLGPAGAKEDKAVETKEEKAAKENESWQSLQSSYKIDNNDHQETDWVFGGSKPSATGPAAPELVLDDDDDDFNLGAYRPPMGPSGVPLKVFASEQPAAAAPPPPAAPAAAPPSQPRAGGWGHGTLAGAGTLMVGGDDDEWLEKNRPPGFAPRSSPSHPEMGQTSPQPHMPAPAATVTAHAQQAAAKPDAKGPSKLKTMDDLMMFDEFSDAEDGDAPMGEGHSLSGSVGPGRHSQSGASGLVSPGRPLKIALPAAPHPPAPQPHNIKVSLPPAAH